MLLHNAVVSCWCTSMMNIAPHSFVKHEATMVSAHGIPYKTKLHKTAISLRAYTTAVVFRYRSHCTPSAHTQLRTCASHCHARVGLHCACAARSNEQPRVHGSHVHVYARAHAAIARPCSSCARESSLCKTMHAKPFQSSLVEVAMLILSR